MMPERASRTFICSVLFLDIVEYSRKPVAEQIQIKDRFNGLIASAISDIPTADRIILDTGDGVAINFLGDPEDALFVAMSLRDAFATDPEQPPEVPARIGINLGPVRLVRDLNGRPNIIGDGINVAQRVMGFAKVGQILVSRSYYEIVSHISDGYTKLFAYEGSRTDKHVREHEIYSVGFSTTDTVPGTLAKRSQRSAREARNLASIGGGTTTRLMFQVERWLSNRSLAYGTTGFAALAFMLALVTSVIGESRQETEQAPVLQSPKKRAPAAAATSTQTAPSQIIASSTTDQPAPTNVADPVVPAAAEEPVEEPAPAKRKLRFPFFKRAEKAAEPEATDETANAEMQEQEPTADPADDPVATVEEDNATEESAPTAEQESNVERAMVALAISPWGEVYVDGKLVGVTPPVNEVEVPAGRRTIEIRNGQFPPYTQRVELKPRQKIKIRYKFN